MIFDNSDKVIKLNKRRYFALLIYLLLMGLLILSDVFKETILGYDKSIYIGAFTVLYCLYILFVFVSNYNYFYYSDNGDKLIFRFASLRPFDNKKRAIEIDKKNFRGYTFRDSFFNLKRELVLSVKTKTGIANYPPISISALSPKHRKKLVNELEKFK